jgi:RNA polymerase sigma factor (sigma-70 family)
MEAVQAVGVSTAEDAASTPRGTWQSTPVARPFALPATPELRTVALIRRVQAGDDAAFADLYQLHAIVVQKRARSLLRGSADVEDVVQQVFANVLEALPSYVLGGPDFDHWLARITHNVSIDHLRKHRRVAPLPQEELDRCREASAPEMRGLFGVVPSTSTPSSLNFRRPNNRSWYCFIGSASPRLIAPQCSDARRSPCGRGGSDDHPAAVAPVPGNRKR